MTVVAQTTSLYRYFGLSTDVKPSTGVPVGATFIETNTGATYVYNGSAWVLTNDSVNIPFTVSALRSRLTDSDLTTAYSYTVPANTYKLVLQAFVANVWYTLDGGVTSNVAPAQYYGFCAYAGTDPLMVAVVPGQILKFIREAAGAILTIQPGA